eukprot:g1699.t1
MTERYELLIESAPAKDRTSERGSTTPIYRSKLNGGNFPADYEGCRTIYELFTKGCREFKTRRLHGKRERQPDGSVTDFNWQTYREVELTTSAIQKALRLTGCSRGSKIGVYGANAPEWTQSMLACSFFSAICVPLYDSLGPNATEYILTHSGIEFVFVSELKCSSLSATVRAMGTKATQIRGVCIWSDLGDVEDSKIKSSIQEFKDAGIDVKLWDEFILSGSAVESTSADELNPTPEEDPENAAVIMYTSGTTGDVLITILLKLNECLGTPKGVVISHRAIIANIASALIFGEEYVNRIEDEVNLSYLTTAHIYGFISELLVIASGARVGYWQGKIDKLLDDIKALRPTSLPGVPRVWERILDATMNKIERRGLIAKTVFDWGYYWKKMLMHDKSGNSPFTKFLDWLLFSKIRANLGGRLEFVSSGAAPLPKHVEEFLRVALTIPILQGYGLTETCAVTCLTLPNRHDMFGTVGAVLPCAEFRLESVPELGYDAQGTPPAGEVCFRGPAIFSTYYHNTEEYIKVVDEDGFFHTGDIAQLTNTGALKIIDRKKNIFKLSQGEYVAVEKIESVLRAASTVDQIWVYGDSCRRALIAIVHPNFEFLTSFVSPGTSIEEICRSQVVKKEILNELNTVAKEGGLQGFERVRNIAIVSEGFNVENGLMTPSFKLKRHDLMKKFNTIITDLYAELEENQT